MRDFRKVPGKLLQSGHSGEPVVQTLCDLTRIVAHCRLQRANPNYLFEEHFIRYA